RPLMIYVNNAKLEQPHVAAYVRFYLESAGELVPQVGYVALEADRYQAELAKLPQASSGTQP
ncbi:MAG: phosphate-binding protein, partial [Longimicrobiales bacterium]